MDNGSLRNKVAAITTVHIVAMPQNYEYYYALKYQKSISVYKKTKWAIF